MARCQLPVGGADLPARQPAAGRTPPPGARQAPAARPLGHHARAEPDLRAPQPGHPEPGPERHLHLRSRSRRARDGGQHLPGGHLQRALPGRHPGHRGDGPAVQAVLLPRRHPLARGPGDARLHPRGRRARLLAGARLRGRVRPPGPARGVRDRRRRGRDRAAGRQLALGQVPQPGQRRRGAADPAPERLQDRQPDRAGPDPARGAGVAAARLRVHPVHGGGRRPQAGAPAARRDHGPGHRRDPRHPAPRPRRRRPGQARLAGDRAAHPQGLDRAQGGGRPAGGGHLAGAPGPAGRGPAEPGAPGPARGVDALLPRGGTVRRERGPDPRTGRAGPGRRPADGREPARQRGPAPARPAAARLPRLRRGRARAGRDHLGGHPGARRLAARRDQGQPVELPAVRPGRDRIQPARPTSTR